MTGIDPPPPRGRERLSARERRQQLAVVAADQFRRRGYHRVALADVADAVGLTAPAIYRHFQNKQDLLAAAIETAIDAAELATDETGSAGLEGMLDRLARAAVDRADLWVLLQRERRHLEAARREPLDARFTAFVATVRSAVAASRPAIPAHDVGLVVTAVLAVLASPAVYRRPVPPEEQASLLSAAAIAVCEQGARGEARGAAVSPGGDDAAYATTESVARANRDREPHTAVTRRDDIVRTAVTLFLERGYDSVSLDDIGAASGIAGASLYHYFPTKDSLLVAAFTVAVDGLAARDLRVGATLDELVVAQVRVGIDEPAMVGLYILEGLHLPTGIRNRIRATLSDEIRTWVRALRLVRPDLADADAAVLVQAARAVVYDVVRVPGFLSRPRLTDELVDILHAVLAAPVGDRRARPGA